jgi:hypothetical protein
VNRKFGICAALTFLLFSSSCFAQDAPATKSLKPELTISVHDYANVPAELLAAAEAEAHGIFHRAGVETVWLNCSAKLEKTQPAICYVVDSTHLVVQVLSHAKSANFHYRIEVLGIANLDENGVGYYAYIFYDRVQRISEERKLGQALLADVLAHEVGHLLLGSPSHSMTGIMTGRWAGEGLRSVSEGSLLFSSLESRTMRNRLRSGRNGRVHAEPIARQQEVLEATP